MFLRNQSHPKIVGFVFARGGSKSVLRKNLRLLDGKPLLAHAIETGLASRWIERMIVSTDDEEIAAAARRWGAETPFLRPAELASDAAPEWLAWRHAVQQVSQNSRQPLEVFVSVPATCPLRTADDVDRCIEAFLAGGADLVLTVCSAHRSPYYNMVTVEPNSQQAALVIPPAKCIQRRQEAPNVYDITTAAYVADPAYILRGHSLFDGVVRAVVLPQERALDIDTELDLQFAEFLWTKQQKTSRKTGQKTRQKTGQKTVTENHHQNSWIRSLQGAEKV